MDESRWQGLVILIVDNSNFGVHKAQNQMQYKTTRYHIVDSLLLAEFTFRRRTKMHIQY